MIIENYEQLQQHLGNADQKEAEDTGVIQDSVYSASSLFSRQMSLFSKHPSMQKTKKCRCICCIVILAMIGTGVGLGVWLGTKKPNEPVQLEGGAVSSDGSSPAASGNGDKSGGGTDITLPTRPTPDHFDPFHGVNGGKNNNGDVPPDHYRDIRYVLTSVTDAAVLDEVGETEDDASPQHKALRWLAYYDPSLPLPSDPSLITRYVLTVLFYSTGGQSWFVNSQWLMEEDVCRWYGVACKASLAEASESNEGKDGNNANVVEKGSDGGRVNVLKLPGNNLAGFVPNEISLLSDLEEVSLYFNSINGTLPTTIGNLAQLKKLALYKNNITGSLPTTLGSLTNLETISVKENDLTGTIPTEIGHMESLEKLELFSNDLKGPIPTEIGMLTELRRAWLNNNTLDGQIPDAIFTDLTKLESLCLEHNLLTGTLPSSVSDETKLYDIRVHNNSINGPIPDEWGKLKHLAHLYLNDNEINGSLPSSLGKRLKMKELSFYGNRINGTIPHNIGELNLRRNHFPGVLFEYESKKLL